MNDKSIIITLFAVAAIIIGVILYDAHKEAVLKAVNVALQNQTVEITCVCECAKGE